MAQFWFAQPPKHQYFAIFAISLASNRGWGCHMDIANRNSGPSLGTCSRPQWENHPRSIPGTQPQSGHPAPVGKLSLVNLCMLSTCGLCWVRMMKLTKISLTATQSASPKYGLAVNPSGLLSAIYEPNIAKILAFTISLKQEWLGTSKNIIFVK